MPHAEASLGLQAEIRCVQVASMRRAARLHRGETGRCKNVRAQKRQPKLPFHGDVAEAAPYSAAASAAGADVFLRPTRANLLRNFSTR
ncbi:MAG: hypothetical protein ABJD97_09075, partial [Betaproteobacteria bacterium]